jgi:hypothetical protein
MEIKYSFVCDYAAKEQSGKLYVMGMFSTIFSKTFPCKHPQFTYVAGLKFNVAETGKHKFSISFVDYDGKKIVPSVEGEININDAGGVIPIMPTFHNVQFPKAGLYQLDLVVDDQHAASDTISLLQPKSNN